MTLNARYICDKSVIHDLNEKIDLTYIVKIWTGEKRRVRLSEMCSSGF